MFYKIKNQDSEVLLEVAMGLLITIVLLLLGIRDMMPTVYCGDDALYARYTQKLVNQEKQSMLELVVPEPEPEPSYQPPTTGLGEFKITYYCGCEKCNGVWAGSPTASGTWPQQGRTIAADLAIFNFGDKVSIGGRTYVVEDTGSAIVGKRIDIYVDDHEYALECGVDYMDVYLVE